MYFLKTCKEVIFVKVKIKEEGGGCDWDLAPEVVAKFFNLMVV